MRIVNIAAPQRPQPSFDLAADADPQAFAAWLDRQRPGLSAAVQRARGTSSKPPRRGPVRLAVPGAVEACELLLDDPTTFAAWLGRRRPGLLERMGPPSASTPVTPPRVPPIATPVRDATPPAPTRDDAGELLAILRRSGISCISPYDVRAAGHRGPASVAQRAQAGDGDASELVQRLRERGFIG